MTGVDRLHDEGIMGKNVKIGIVDTGLDYNHPAVS
jgi:subtilisin family serine protease